MAVFILVIPLPLPLGPCGYRNLFLENRPFFGIYEKSQNSVIVLQYLNSKDGPLMRRHYSIFWMCLLLPVEHVIKSEWKWDKLVSLVFRDLEFWERF
jgi:hypothetical protein